MLPESLNPIYLKTSLNLHLMIMNNDFNPERVALSIDIEELYDLDVTIARFILPRLMLFKEHCERTPNLNMPKEEWDKILDKMIYAFERIALQTEEDTPEYKAYISSISITAVCGGKPYCCN